MESTWNGKERAAEARQAPADVLAPAEIAADEMAAVARAAAGMARLKGMSVGADEKERDVEEIR